MLFSKDYAAYLDWMQLLQDFNDNKLTADWISDWQNRRLTEVLQLTANKSVFYNNKLEGIDLKSITIENISKLPFTTKQDLRDQHENILCGPIKYGAIFYNTSGTSGKPTPAPRTKMEYYRGIATLTFGMKRALKDILGRPETGAVILGPSELHATGDVFGNAFMDLGFTVFKVWPFSPKSSFDRIMEILIDYKIEIMLAPWGMLQRLYRAFQNNNFDVKNLNLEYVMVLGEICSKEAERNLSNIWNAKLLNIIYASQEASISAILSEDDVQQLLPFSYIYENIEIGGDAPVKEGVVGELVLTMIQPDCMKPLIRYRTGDTCIIRSTPKYTLHSPVLTVLGRISDYLKLGSILYSPVEIEVSIMKYLNHCIGYKLNISQRNGTDLLVIELDFAGKTEKDGIKQIKNHWRALGVKCTITSNELIFDKNKQIQSSTELTGMTEWKTARIFDLREGGNSKEVLELSRTKGSL